MSREKTDHMQRVESFMVKAGQTVQDKPTIPDEATRLLRAKLIFEEAVKELIGEGLAVDIILGSHTKEPYFVIRKGVQPDLVKIADGAADTLVVTTGTLLACGIADKEIQEAVDNSNLAKFTTPGCPVCNSAMNLEKVVIEGVWQKVWQCSLRLDEHPHLPANAGGYKSDGTDGNAAGKWIKPKDWKAPDIAGILEKQSNPIKQLKRDEVSYTSKPLTTRVYCVYLPGPDSFRHLTDIHPGGWATVDKPPADPGDLIRFYLYGELKLTGTVTQIDVPSVPAIWGELDFTNWWKVRFEKDGSK